MLRLGKKWYVHCPPRPADNESRGGQSTVHSQIRRAIVDRGPWTVDDFLFLESK